MILIKHSERTVRTPCKSCGELDLYWMHDTSPEAKAGAKYCANHGSRSWVLVNANSMLRSIDSGDSVSEDTVVRHFTTCTDRQAAPAAASEAAAPAADPLPSPAPTAEPEEGSSAREALEQPALAPAPSSGGADGELEAAIRTLMSHRSQPVDREEVERIAREVIADVVLPRTHTHERADGERIEVDGAHERLCEIVGDLIDDEHVMMVGPSGTGKSKIAEDAAKALGITFRPMSVSAQTTEARFFGFVNATEYVRTPLRDCWEHGGLFLIDEIDKGNANIVCSLQLALSGSELTFPDGATIARHPDFRVVTTANTYGRGADHRYVGSNKLDAAFLDRFTVETIDYDETVEAAMCAATGLDDAETGYTVRQVLDAVRAMRRVALSDSRMQAVVSPRASVGICKKLARGRGWDDAFEVSLFKGMSADDRAKLQAK